MYKCRPPFSWGSPSAPLTSSCHSWGGGRGFSRPEWFLGSALCFGSFLRAPARHFLSLRNLCWRTLRLPHAITPYCFEPVTLLRQGKITNSLLAYVAVQGKAFGVFFFEGAEVSSLLEKVPCSFVCCRTEIILSFNQHHR